MEQELPLLAVLLRNNLVHVLLIGKNADRCGTGFRCLNLEAVDNSIIFSLLFLVAAEGVVELTGGLRIGIIDLRSSRISIALFLTCIGNAGEVEVHLEARGALVVLNGPVNDDVLTGSCFVLVVAGHIVSNLGVLLAVRNEVVDNLIGNINFAALRGSGSGAGSGTGGRTGGSAGSGLRRRRSRCRVADSNGQRLGLEGLYNVLAVGNALNSGLVLNLLIIRNFLITGNLAGCILHFIVNSGRDAVDIFISVDIQYILAVRQICRQNEIKADERGLVCPRFILCPGLNDLVVREIIRLACCNPCIIGVDVVRAVAARVRRCCLEVDSSVSLIVHREHLSGESCDLTAGVIITGLLRLTCCRAALNAVCFADPNTGIEAELIFIVPGIRILLNGDAVVAECILIVLGHFYSNSVIILRSLNRALTESLLAVDRHLQVDAVETAGLRNINRNRNGLAFFGSDLIFTIGSEGNDRIIDLRICCSVCTESQSAAHSRRCENERRKSRDEFLHDNLILSGLIPGKPPSRSKRIVYLVLLGLSSAFLRRHAPGGACGSFADHEMLQLIRALRPHITEHGIIQLTRASVDSPWVSSSERPERCPRDHVP